jgi:hypothetical protein
MPIVAKTPTQIAGHTDKWTEILFRALTYRVAMRWRFASFRGSNGGEWRGVVDVLAVRKNTSAPTDARLKPGDLFEMILVQMKGGDAALPTAADIARIRIVQKHYGAREVVLYEWKRKTHSRFSRLIDGKWVRASAEEIFG